MKDKRIYVHPKLLEEIREEHIPGDIFEQVRVSTAMLNPLAKRNLWQRIIATTNSIKSST